LLTRFLDHPSQDLFIKAQNMDTSSVYERHMSNLRKLSRDQGVERVLREYGVDVILGPTDSGLTSMASAGGKYSSSLYAMMVPNTNLPLV
jgi:amidase